MKKVNSNLVDVNFYKTGYFNNEQLTYSVVCAYLDGKLVLVKHQNRDTWEIPGGHLEEGESSREAAERELYEETGADGFIMYEVCEYSVTYEGETKNGALFLAVITDYDELPDESEIEEVELFEDLPENLTYYIVQPKLYAKVLEYIKSENITLDTVE